LCRHCRERATQRTVADVRVVCDTPTKRLHVGELSGDAAALWMCLFADYCVTRYSAEQWSSADPGAKAISALGRWLDAVEPGVATGTFAWPDAAELIRNPDGTYNWTNNDKMMDGGVEVDCRNRPEDFDGDKDEDGCPDLLKIDNCQIKLSDKIYFKFNKWDIDPRSFKVLDEVKDTLNAAPDIKIWIEGHTDSKGSNKSNITLSQKRVNSVRDYLVKVGIASDRLEPLGHGEEKPIDTNKTAEGRAANRRVEFNLKDCKKTIQ
jgi:outer membrane protein OmpA-like peptidoglycan-associated protein